MAKKTHTSSGGKAEAAGSNYEILVATWYGHSILLGGVLDPPFGLSAGTSIESLTCQSDAPVDDVNAYTSEAGIIFVQAKRSVDLSSAAASGFAGALDQFVRQYQACTMRDPRHIWSRPLDPARDRLVLSTRSSSSRKIIDTLPELLRRIRDKRDERTLAQVAVSQVERSVAKVTEKNLKRSWKAAFGKAPTNQELSRLLRLIWIQELDLESGKRDRKAILEHFRANLLEDRTQATLAFSNLFRLSTRFRAERSGTDRLSLMDALAESGIRLTAAPDYRNDIAALRKWTKARLESAPRFTRLLVDNAQLVIDRAVWPVFQQAANVHSLLLVGEPGAGKSGVMYRLGEGAVATSQDVVFLPVDLLNVETFSGLRSELGVDHELADILAHWPGMSPALLIVDALDAARKPETQKLLREVVAAVLRTGTRRWRVVASVRKYDLRQGAEWSALFSGAPPIPAHADREFSHVRHVSIGPLADDEVSQIATPFPALAELYAHASDKLRDLLQNIFNLRLLAELLHAGVTSSDLNAITTQPELLDRYWRHRIRRDDGKHDAREETLTTVANEMISVQMLRVLRADIRKKVNPDSLVDLERHGILRPEDQSGKPNEDVLLFSHHVLFDYAVARLIFGRGRDAAQLVGLLRSRRELALMLTPSLTLALSDAWNSDRSALWKLAHALAEEPGLPEVARLAAPMVIAEHTKSISDLEPLFEGLQAAHRSASEIIAQHIVGAIFVRERSGVPLVGPAAGPWMIFAQKLTVSGSDRVKQAAHALVGKAIEAL